MLLTARLTGHVACQGGMGSVAAAAIEAVRATEGLEAAQTLVDRVARLPSPGGDFWRAAVHLEAAAAQAADASALGRSTASAQVSTGPAHCGRNDPLGAQHA